MNSTATKSALVSEAILFESGREHDRINHSYPHNMVDVISMDVSGSPVTPTSGEYRVHVKTSAYGGWKSLSDNGILDATLTGGSSLPDGVGEGATFDGNPFSIKVTPTGIVGAVSYSVTVTQNLS